MDYGSLYGMGPYFGQDYTAFVLIRLVRLTEEQLSRGRFGGGFDGLPPNPQAAARDEMRRELRGIDLNGSRSRSLAAAIVALRTELAKTRVRSI